MSKPFLDNFDRRVLPRWRDTGSADNKTMSPLRPRDVTGSFSDEIARVTSELATMPTAAVAVDALNVAFVSGNPALAKAAREALETDISLSPALRQRFLNIGETESDNGSLPSADSTGPKNIAGIQRIRGLLKEYPNNPLLYLDLARHYAILGHHEKAQRASKAALWLAPHHRLVLRSVARYFLNTGTEEGETKAHRLLIDSPATPQDPWLIAAELAVAQEIGQSPRFLREAKAMLRSRSHLPENLSELASAVGTWEILDGTRRHAKEAFNLALLAPTENALAQAKWAEKRLSSENSALDRWLGKLPSAYEALTMRAYQEGDLRTAALHAQSWYYDEPFSAGAAITASYICSILDNYGSVLEMSRTALVSQPDNSLLENNRIFARISGGSIFNQNDRELEEESSALVQQLLGQIRAENGDTAHAAANLGLLAYRCGYLEEGRLAYQYAIDWATGRKEWFSVANAAMFHAREALIARAPWSDAVIQGMEDACARIKSPGLSFYLDKIRAVAANPEKASEILSPESARTFSPVKPKHSPKLDVRKDADGRLTITVPRWR